MKKEKKIKIFLGISYLFIILGFLWVFFVNFSLSEITSYDFIKNNKQHFNLLKENNFFLVSLLFLFFCNIWTLLGGFGMPIFLMSGFIFGKWIGTIYAAVGLALGATLLYIFANYFFKDLVKKKFYKRFIKFREKFKKHEFNFFIIYRFIGGIPFFLSNILPTIFNIKIKNFFFGTIIGMLPQIFIFVSLGSGISKLIEKNLDLPSLTDFIFLPDIYFPIFGFIILLVGIIIIKSYIYKDKG